MNRAYSRAGIIARLFNQPLAVTPQTAAIVLGAVGPRLDVAQLFVATEGRVLGSGELEELASSERVKIEARGGVDRKARHARAEQLMFVHNGVAHIAIRGETVAENGIGPMSGFTGYDGIVASVQSADADPNVKGILLDIDSPGGEVAGLFECAAILMARRGTKPMRSMIRGMGCSAAYTIAACGDPGEVTLHDLGYAGSNGIISMHADFSQALEQDGVKVTLFTAGAHKADGNPFESLPEDVARSIQARVEISYSRLVAHVAAARGLTPDDVIAQQAQIYQGQDAVKAGLADKIMSWQDSMDEFEQQVNSPASRGPGGTAPTGASTPQKGTAMDPTANAPATQDQPVYTQSQQDQAVATATEAATSTATEAERSRITGLAEIDASSTLSAELSEAIAAGTSIADFALAQSRAAKAKLNSAAEAAKSEAVPAGKIPEGGASAAVGSEAEANRGAAYAAKKAGKAAI